jgi:hypothetical protein
MPMRYVVPTASAIRIRFVIARFLTFIPERKAIVIETSRIMPPPLMIEGRGVLAPKSTGISGKDAPMK